VNIFGILFTLATSILLLRVRRSWAPLPLLLGAAYITRMQQLEIGPLHFSAVRILVAVGMWRVNANGERISGGMNLLDRVVGLWAIWNICSLAFHKSDLLVYRLGTTYDTVGVYYLFRVFIRGVEDVRIVFKMVSLLLIPVAATMLVERFKGINLLSLIGFGEVWVNSTNGHYRAQGAFGHAILAGVDGAVCLPMAIFFWRQQRNLALVGIATTLAIVYASGSSGPIMTTGAVLLGLALWKVRSHMRAVRWAAVFGVIGLSFIMKDPVYFVMARIDITGGSTGYFRAQLIRSAIEHLNEWWFAGTDYTRHWMPTGIVANPNHTDITNHYLAMGVAGGLPLMLLFMWMLFVAFVRVGQAMRASQGQGAPLDQQFAMWTLGSILFGHATAFWSISYFDQTMVFLCLVLSCIGSLPVRQRTRVSIPAGEPKPLPVRNQVYA
jgi:hypothetical protein